MESKREQGKMEVSRGIFTRMQAIRRDRPEGVTVNASSEITTASLEQAGSRTANVALPGPQVSFLCPESP